MRDAVREHRLERDGQGEAARRRVIQATELALEQDKEIEGDQLEDEDEPPPSR